MNDIRWRQRFQSFDKAFTLLQTAMEGREPELFSDLEKEGLAQRFEFSFELAWKVMKDVLEYNGVEIEKPVGPRSVVKAAFSSGLIADGQVWIDMMLHRNLLSHTYDSSELKSVLVEIKARYLTAFQTLRDDLAAKMAEEK